MCLLRVPDEDAADQDPAQASSARTDDLAWRHGGHDARTRAEQNPHAQPAEHKGGRSGEHNGPHEPRPWPLHAEQVDLAERHGKQPQGRKRNDRRKRRGLTQARDRALEQPPKQAARAVSDRRHWHHAGSQFTPVTGPSTRVRAAPRRGFAVVRLGSRSSGQAGRRVGWHFLCADRRAIHAGPAAVRRVAQACEPSRRRRPRNRRVKEDCRPVAQELAPRRVLRQ